MMRFLKWAGLGLIGLTLLALVIVVWLTNTQSGLRWALNQAPEVLKVENVKGSLNDFSFDALKVSLDGTDIEVSSGKLSWALLPLISKNLNIQTLQANGVNITTSPPSQPAPQLPYEPWQGLDLPINVSFNSLKINGFILTSKETPEAKAVETARVDKLTTALNLNDNVLTIERLSLLEADNLFELKGQIDLSTKATRTLNVNHSATWRIGEQMLETSGNIVGTWASIQIEQITVSPVQSQLKLTLADVLSQKISWNGRLQTSATQLTIPSDKGLKQDTFELGDGGFDFNGSFEPRTGLPSLLTQVKGQISANHSEYAHWNLLTDVSIQNDTLSITSLELNQFELDKFTPDDQKKSAGKQKPQGKLQAGGSIIGLSDFISQSKNAEATADLSGKWTSLSWPLVQQATEATASMSNSNGTFALIGQANDFRITAQGDGESYANTLKANLDVRVLADTIELNSVKFSSADTQLDISGKLGDKLSLAWAVNSPDLSVLMPSLKGDFISQGRLSGTREKPKFEGSLNSSNLEYKDLSIAGVELNAKGSLTSNLEQIALNANILSIQQASSSVARNVIIALNGTGKEHTVSIDSQLFGQSDFGLIAQGSITDTGWDGRLNTLELADPDYDTWKLQQAISIKLDDAKLNTDLLCLANIDQSVCVNFTANATDTTASVTLNAVDLASFNPVLGLRDISLSGLVNGELDYQKSTTKTASTINATLNAVDTLVSFQRAQGEAQSLSISTVSASIVQQDNLKVDAVLRLDNGDEANIKLGLDSYIESPEMSTASLTGRIIAKFENLSTLQAAIPSLSNLSGSLNSDIAISGNMSEPKVAMKTQLKDANLAIQELGLNLQAINVTVTSADDQKIEVSGSLNSGKGSIDIEGSLDFEKLDRPLMLLSLKGSALELMNTPEIFVEGDVNLNIAANKDLLNLKGEVTLLQADLDFQPPENAILASNDVVLLGQEEVQQGMKTQMDLTLNLGDKTHIRAQGLDALLVGQLQILQAPDGIVRGKGQIDINEGRYDAYNQKLKIDKGRLIFSGGSIDDPSLDMRAQKTVNDIIAGVSVSGRAGAPILQLYSTPSMTDQDVLSVLIFDKPIGELGSQDGLTLLKIANSLRGTGESQVAIMTQRIQDTLGLTNLELQLDNDSPSISAGKQLSSKFYVGYGYGLLDAAQSLILRYKISKAWSIQGDVGADSGADLRYQIER